MTLQNRRKAVPPRQRRKGRDLNIDSKRTNTSLDIESGKEGEKPAEEKNIQKSHDADQEAYRRIEGAHPNDDAAT